MLRKRSVRVRRFVNLFIVGGMLAMLCCSLGSYPSFLEGCTFFNPPSAGPAGTVAWQWTAPSGYSLSRAAAIGPSGNLYVTEATGALSGTASAKLVCVSPQGTALWESKELSGYADTVSVPTVASDGTIYVVDFYTLYAFNANGTEKWEWTTPEDWKPYAHAQISGLTLGPDGTVYVAHCEGGSYHRFLFALNSDGSMKWARDLADPYIGNGASDLTVGKSGVLYTLQGYEASLYAYDSDNGSILWHLELDADVSTGGFAIGPNGTIYVPSYMNKLIAVSPDGYILWENGSIPSPGIPSFGPDGTLYVVGSSGYVKGDLYALSPSGTIEWHTGNAPARCNLATAQDGTVYGRVFYDYGDVSYYDTSNFSAINADGTVLWSLALPGVGLGSAAIASNGTLYVTGADTLTAIYGSSPLAASAWPRGRHGNRNTGDSAG